MPMGAAETDKVIRQKLEASGQLGKMRAMVMEAAVKALTSEEDGTSKMFEVFAVKPALQEAKEKTEGKYCLAAVLEYLQHLGLEYTANILRLEASLAGVDLPTGSSLRLAVCRNEVSSPANATVLETFVAGGGSQVPLTALSAPQSTLPTPTPATVATSVAKAPAVAEKSGPVAENYLGTGVDTTYAISNWKSGEFYRQNQVAGQQVQLEYMDDCKVFILDPLDSITVDDVVNSEITIAACEGSVFLRMCKNLIVHVACKQLRLRDCENVEVRLFASTDPVVESSHHVTFKPFHLRLPNLCQSFKESRLNPAVNRFVHVYDFTSDDATLPKPHFTVLYPDHGLTMVNACSSKGTPECPIEIEDLLDMRLLPAASSESGATKSYNIKTGSTLWSGAESATVPAAAAAVPATATLPIPAMRIIPKVEAKIAAPVRNPSESYSSFSDSDAKSADESISMREDEDEF